MDSCQVTQKALVASDQDKAIGLYSSQLQKDKVFKFQISFTFKNRNLSIFSFKDYQRERGWVSRG